MTTVGEARRPTRPTRPAAVRTPPPERRPFRDNPRLILLGIVLLFAALAAMVWFADHSPGLNPDFLSEVVLYALSAADLTMVLALIFFLARNVVKLFVERRRGLPFSRFRAKLVMALLGLTIVPSVLVLLVGGELIRSSTQLWFSQPVDEVLRSAVEIGGDYYREHEAVVGAHATRIARTVSAAAVLAGDVDGVRRTIAPEVTQGRVGLVEVYRIQPGGTPLPLVAVESPALPRGHVRGLADRLATRIASGSADSQTVEPLDGGGELVRAGAIVRDPASRPVGVVIASDPLRGDLALHARRITDAYENYSQLRVVRRPLEGVYLSLFLMMTLMILVSATWTGLYLAKRITRPVQLLAAGAREIGAGRLDHRIELETRDEFGSLVEAFNTMAGELAASQRKLERSRVDMERKNLQLDERRRYIETVLERIATGVVSVAADGRIETINTSALRLLALDPSAIGRASTEAFAREDLHPLNALLQRVHRPSSESAVQEVAVMREGRELHLAAAATPLQGEDGAAAGAVLVFDDVTPLIRTQRVAAWRDVARRLAHEIKNPLTPIQLSAERMRRHFGSAPAAARALVDECTATIVSEVESLKALVDEFAQFARMPAPRAIPADLNAVLADTLALYNGLFQGILIDRRLTAGLPPVRVDVEQIRRVVINLIDNAVEALGGGRDVASTDPEATIVVETEHDAANGVVRIRVSDNGPGIPPADRDKLFMPYYSTKQRGSGLGLAIVRRIIAEHGGSIEATDNVPSGTVFTIELPV
ncbi:MAG: two-component system, NtrC family, nitrogen regulation sensor histidine kinase NtrY [Acidobacteriota bacterium]|jgi:two-component system nitrogen regulation sensor histidine kinase NtrY